jgi:hypothetical protein
MFFSSFLVFYATTEIRPIRVLEMNLISDVVESDDVERESFRSDFVAEFLTRSVNYWNKSQTTDKDNYEKLSNVSRAAKHFLTLETARLCAYLKRSRLFCFYYHFLILFGTGEISIHLPKPLNVVSYKYEFQFSVSK